MEYKLELKYSGNCDNPNVAKIKNNVLKDFFDFLNSFEFNSEWGNKKLLRDIEERTFKIYNVIESTQETKERELKILTEQRNKLSREISTLKKANLN